MSFFPKRIHLVSTNYGWINKSMFIFLRDHNLDKIIHPVGIPNFTIGGQIGYQYSKYYGRQIL
jgi:hypothetical protein